jgi:GST-like protein
MIDLYTWSTPNGRKIPILLEELGVEYRTHLVDLGKNEQMQPSFLLVSPNNKIPALVDGDAEGGPLSLFESGAILTYLADKHGRFLPRSGPVRWKAQEWLFWQVGGLGPMLGQLAFFGLRSKEKVPLAIQRFTEECERLVGVLNRRLETAPFLAGAEYTIADIACYPWVKGAMGMMAEPLKEAWAKADAVRAWVETIGARPAVQRAMTMKLDHS